MSFEQFKRLRLSQICMKFVSNRDNFSKTHFEGLYGLIANPFKCYRSMKLQTRAFPMSFSTIPTEGQSFSDIKSIVGR